MFGGAVMYERVVLLAVIILFTVILLACSHSVDYKLCDNEIILKNSEDFSYKKAVLVHLNDGGTVRYPLGFTVKSDTIRSIGYLKEWGSEDERMITKHPLDQVQTIEYFDTPDKEKFSLSVLSKALSDFLEFFWQIILRGLRNLEFPS